VPEVFEMRLRHAALGGEPGGQTFERAADLGSRPRCPPSSRTSA
jgi:hypothetical protein